MTHLLVTGGTGFIGSHTCVELLQAGYEVIVVDNLSNSSELVLERIQQITGKRPTFYPVDLLRLEDLAAIFDRHSIAGVLHFAGLKAVGESVEKPVLYYQTNLVSTFNLLELMKRHQVHRLVFSSSATVYSPAGQLPFKEDSALEPLNPYGRTKYMIELLLRDLFQADKRWQIALLRYFNPVGAHASGLIGEDPLGAPNNLMPFISQVAIGRRECLQIFGKDYPTQDGTPIRDYIHVVDLAKGHLAAWKAMEGSLDFGCQAINLGTGKGSSVFEVLGAFQKAAQKDIPYKVTTRRAGDAPASYACVQKARELLAWRAEKELFTMCQDAWRWQQKNPMGLRQ